MTPLRELAAPYNPTSVQYWAQGAPGNAPLAVIAREVLSRSLHQDKVTILDLGFGKGAHWRRAEFPVNVMLTAVDACASWLDDLEGPKPNATIEGLLPSVLVSLPSRSFDIVMALDVIEHLPRHEALLMLYEMQRVSSGIAAIFTPNGLVWQPPSPDNPYNAHLSGWTPRELRALGWTEIYGWGNFKPFMGPYGSRRLKPKGQLGRLAAKAAYRAGRAAVAFPAASFSFTAVVRHGFSGFRPNPENAWDPQPIKRGGALRPAAVSRRRAV